MTALPTDDDVSQPRGDLPAGSRPEQPPQALRTPSTSLSHPLRIDAVPAGAGFIGMTFCPGKKQPNGITAWWDRDLDADLKALLDWKADALVTLIEDQEFDELEVGELGAKARALGLQWMHLPIVDGAAPDERLRAAWPRDGEALRRILRDGGRVVLHCKGGLGRTGTIAVQLMMELGEPLDDAIRKVRAARRGAIETVEQERYLQALAASMHAEGET